MKVFSKIPLMLLAAGLVSLASLTTVEAQSCIPSGGIDDTLYRTHCCSGQAVPGSTYCTNPADYGTTWASCSHICA